MLRTCSLAFLIPADMWRWSLLRLGSFWQRLLSMVCPLAPFKDFSVTLRSLLSMLGVWELILLIYFWPRDLSSPTRSLGRGVRVSSVCLELDELTYMHEAGPEHLWGRARWGAWGGSSADVRVWRTEVTPCSRGRAGWAPELHVGLALWLLVERMRWEWWEAQNAKPRRMSISKGNETSHKDAGFSVFQKGITRRWSSPFLLSLSFPLKPGHYLKPGALHTCNCIFSGSVLLSQAWIPYQSRRKGRGRGGPEVWLALKKRLLLVTDA